MDKEKIYNLDDPKEFMEFFRLKEEWLNNAFREASKDIKPI